jgi:hypothetical protein
VRRRTACVALVALACACAPRSEPVRLDPIAEAYVRTVLALGRHDAGEVDAYHGPPQWKAEADSAAPVPLATIAHRADSLADAADAVPLGHAEELVIQRQHFLARQLRAVAARARMMNGQKMTFDEESKALYDVVAPTIADSTIDTALAELDHVVPGRGPLAARWNRYRARFVIPRARVDTVFRAAIQACRERTLKHFALPATEHFTIEYVDNPAWGGYNWYKGDFTSVIQVNVGLPVYVDRAIDLAAHEGYPGHHVYNGLLEQQLVKKRGWVECSIYPLFAPQSLMAEGTANYGIDVVFPDSEKVLFERDVLFPLAGIDTAQARPYRAALAAMEKLRAVGVEGARRYLDGRMSRDSTVKWLVRCTLSTPERAGRSVNFDEKYRSYVVNYSVGQDLVRAWVEHRAGGDPERRWKVFGELLASPRLPSDLQEPLATH